MQKALQPQGRRTPFFKTSFFGLVKFTKKGLPGTELSTDQAERDTGDGERKWTPLGSEVR